MFKGRFLVELSWRVLGAGVSPGGHQVLIFPRNCPGTVLLVCDRERQPRALRSDECSSHGDTGVLVTRHTGPRLTISSERSVSSVGRSSDHPANCGAHPVKLDQDFHC